MASVPESSPREGARAEPALLVTVVIVNYNGAHLLPACLAGVEAQSFPTEHLRTVVVDNGSSDGSIDLLRTRFPWVEVIPSRENLGFAGGNNLALRRVTTPFVALLNNDAVPEPDWLERLLSAAASGERVGAVTSKLVFQPRFVELTIATEATRPPPPDTRELGVRMYGVSAGDRPVEHGTIWNAAAFPPERDGGGEFRWTRPGGELLMPVPPAGPVTLTLRLAADRPKPVTMSWDGGSASFEAGTEPADVSISLEAGFARVDVLNNAGSRVTRDGYGGDRAFREVDRRQFDTAEEVFALCGAAVLLRVEALNDAGIFDDDFFLYYEDTDLSWRLRARGWSIRYEPAAVARHAHSATSVEWSPTFTFHVERNRLLMLTKNSGGRLASRAVLVYAAGVARLAASAAKAIASGRRPELRLLRLRVRVLGSYLRLLPTMLGRRRTIARRAIVRRRDLERWLEP